ncbi:MULTISPECIES: hypothetical protein [unclassified Leifsonia]|uniref:hypothetical protein n=1 Tax=unclassified Leifsonia TaxID=2663824 RepID=UPI0008A80544|nr:MULTISPECIES: hypothetical protein [unclassified Leifsonia]SEI12821.1 hypothetical protein SAMN04515694_11863 [Leifsonia sp. CL154]SFL96441.1 hypothetical protein SAMN04515692_11924 [Leifsonia sp. CL147]
MTAGTTSTRRPDLSGPLRVPRRLRFAGREVPWWAAVLVVYAVSRLLTTTLMLALFVAANLGHWDYSSPLMDPTFFTFSGSWDGAYYSQIVEQGYPTSLPLDSDGSVQQNPWAFLPLFPMAARVVMLFTGLSFYPAGFVVAMAFGAAASVVLFRLVAARAGVSSAFWATAFFCFGPLSFVLQIAYAESMFFFLMFAALLAMVHRRYWLMLPFGVAAAFTRPGALALPLALFIVLLVRTINARRGGDGFRPRERLAIVLTGALTAVAGLSWPIIAAAVTGTGDAYISTELSWWTGFIGKVAFIPLTPWFLLSWRYLSILGALIVISIIAGYAWVITRPSIRALGTELVAYAASYGLYLFAVFLPQQSTFRLLLPLSPLAGARGLTRHRRARKAALIACVALQPVAIVLLWFVGYP